MEICGEFEEVVAGRLVIHAYHRPCMLISVRRFLLGIMLSLKVRPCRKAWPFCKLAEVCDTHSLASHTR